MIKRICAALLLLTLFLNQLICLPAIADGETVDTEPAFVLSNAEARPGETVQIEVSIRNNPGIVALRLKVKYDGSVMKLTDADPDALAMSFGPKTRNPFTMSWADGLHGNNTTVGVVAILTFVVADDATPGNYPITILYDAEDVCNLEDQNILFE